MKPARLSPEVLKRIESEARDYANNWAYRAIRRLIAHIRATEQEGKDHAG